MACACYVIILQRILYWFVREKADDSPVSDLFAGKFTSFISSMKTTKYGFHIQTNVLLYSFPSTVIVFANILPSGVFICLELASRGRSMSTVTSSTSSFSVCSFRTWGALGCLRIYSHYLLPASLWTWLLLPFCL